MFGPLSANCALEGIGELRRPRTKLFSAAMGQAKVVNLPFTRYIAPNLPEAPGVLQGPTRCRSLEVGEIRRRPTVARRAFLGTGRLATGYLRYIITGKVAGACADFGAQGGTLKNFAPWMDLSIAQNMETASTYAKARMQRLARER